MASTRSTSKTDDVAPAAFAADAKGLRVPRVFSDEHVHPYDQLTWEHRDAVTRDFKTGEATFEQRGVEFPATWSLNATSIVATKYFRGQLGSPEREHSVRQMIDRVADTITEQGVEHGYFATAYDAQVFNDELKWLLVNQHGSFNSPVWFNIGAPGRRAQASACFILSVEDSMDSILNWYVEEGKIFQGGSGAGTNLSRLRGSKEGLSGGGTASGPVSFMRGADASAGTISSGGTTRRAAKMVILDADHPDIEEFVATKAKQEDLALALKAAGYDPSFTGDDAPNVLFQNANNSVGATDAFMQAVVDDVDWDLVNRGDGQVARTVRARDLFRQISQAAWRCADPGMFYLDTINRMHTTPEAGPIRSSNPCSEFVRPDNSSCNLASLNLVKFLTADGGFDVDRYEAAVRVFITAMDILISFADFPTEAITAMTRRYRDLGLGYSNLGALLMRSGLAYDSDGGRAYAAALTAVMGGAAYHQSSVLAEAVGPFDGYAPDADAMQKVIRRHKRAVGDIDKSLAPAEVLKAARKAWKDADEAGKAHGYRNAQVTLLAPTGTISFKMDCDTTGIEPDLGLVKLKKLHGGGSMKIVNASVRPALEALGYDHDQVEAISTHILETGSVLDSGLHDDHQAVFACAMGDVTISADGHMRMMAAAQPFLSGAVSKTINCPEDTTVEEIERIYLQAWQLGIKCIAIYRDNSKGGQPLSVAGSKADAQRADADAAAQGCCTGGCACTAGPARQRLPRKRHSETTSFEVGEASGYLTVGEYDDGRPGELFLKLGKQGSTLSGLLDAFAIAMSLGLQYGVPVDAYVAKFLNMRFEPAGMTNDPDARIAQSLVDYVARRMAFDYLPRETRESMGLLTIAERTAALEAGDGHDDDAAGEPAPTVDQQLREEMTDAPLCLDCGGPMKRAGTCFACEQCGSTSGCS